MFRRKSRRIRRAIVISPTSYRSISAPNTTCVPFSTKPTTRVCGSAYPQTRVVGFVENGTHVVFGAEMDRYDVGEITIARRILRLLRRNMLCLADRNFTNYPLWKQACTTGAALVWRAKTGIILPKLRKLSDGSYLAKFYPSPTHRRHDREGILVRVIEYQIDGFR